MVSDTETNGVVCWSESGDSFLVKDEHVLASEVLPRYFRHKNFSSFVRQLNFYGFRKQTSRTLNNTSIFAHPYFRRGERNLLTLIKRKTSDSTSQSMKLTIERLESQIEELRTKHDQILRVQEKIFSVLRAFVARNPRLSASKRPRITHALANNDLPEPATKRSRLLGPNLMEQRCSHELAGLQQALNDLAPLPFSPQFTAQNAPAQPWGSTAMLELIPDSESPSELLVEPSAVSPVVQTEEQSGLQSVEDTVPLAMPALGEAAVPLAMPALGEEKSLLHGADPESFLAGDTWENDNLDVLGDTDETPNNETNVLGNEETLLGADNNGLSTESLLLDTSAPCGETLSLAAPPANEDGLDGLFNQPPS